MLAASVDFRNYFSIGERDRLISPPMNLAGADHVALYFEHAYAQYWAGVTDSLIVYVSTDCGETWIRIYEGGENGNGSFGTHPITTDGFQPQEPADWCLEGFGAQCNSISLDEWAAYDNVKIMFETSSFFGNPIYIDNIMVDVYADLDETGSSVVLSGIYPNPSHGEITIELPASNQPMMIDIYDLMGKNVYTEQLQPGSSRTTRKIDLGKLPGGVYFLVLNNGNEKATEKLLLY